MKLDAVVNKLNQLETIVKSQGKRLDQVSHSKKPEGPQGLHDSASSEAQASRQAGDMRSNVSLWLRRISVADVIQLLILIAITSTLIYQALSYRQAVESDRHQTRAWVGTGVYNSWVHVPEPNTNLAKWHIGIKNYGQSPALEVNYHTRLLTIDRDAGYDEEKQKQFLRQQVDGLAPMPPTDGSPVFPGEDMPNEGFADKPFTDDQISRFRSGGLWVVVIGKVFYKDIFGDSHVTQFCRVGYPPTPGRPEGGMGACLVGDRAD